MFLTLLLLGSYDDLKRPSHAPVGARLRRARPTPRAIHSRDAPHRRGPSVHAPKSTHTRPKAAKHCPYPIILRARSFAVCSSGSSGRDFFQQTSGGLLTCLAALRYPYFAKLKWLHLREGSSASTCRQPRRFVGWVNEMVPQHANLAWRDAEVCYNFGGVKFRSFERLDFQASLRFSGAQLFRIPPSGP